MTHFLSLEEQNVRQMSQLSLTTINNFKSQIEMFTTKAFQGVYDQMYQLLCRLSILPELISSLLLC